MKRLISFIIVPFTVVLLLAVWLPRHRENMRAGKALLASPVVAVDTRSATASQDTASRDSASTANAERIGKVLVGDPIRPDDNARASAAMVSRRAGARQLKPANQRDRFDLPILPVPTVAQMEGTLAVPLAFLKPSAETGLTDEQAGGLAEIARQFNATVSAAGQDPTDPVYAKTYYEAQKLADEQVYAAYGQDAYTALINQRAQAAGNIFPDL